MLLPLCLLISRSLLTYGQLPMKHRQMVFLTHRHASTYRPASHQELADLRPARWHYTNIWITLWRGVSDIGPLFYTYVLHQTTTRCCYIIVYTNCSIPMFYIKPQLLPTCRLSSSHCSIPMFYIKPQLKRENSFFTKNCSIPMFYIKPQHNEANISRRRNCSIPMFYIKPQLFGINL